MIIMSLHITVTPANRFSEKNVQGYFRKFCLKEKKYCQYTVVTFTYIYKIGTDFPDLIFADVVWRFFLTIARNDPRS